MASTGEPGDTFLYFGYGSNMLKERIHIQNPSAIKKAIGKLQDYKLCFNFRSRRWNGAVATIEQSPGDHVWGVVWELNKEHLASLDDQEGVHYGVYAPMSVSVMPPCGEQLKCRSYQLLIKDNEDKRPSKAYKDVLLKGALENELPEEYQHKLSDILDNGVSEGIDLTYPDPPQT